MFGRKRHWITIGASALSLALTSAALAQSEADFFKGKTVNYIIATAPGGGYDLYGRLVAEYMQKHLPGSTFVPRNMPGAGHIIGANFIYASKPDGLTIGTFNTGLIYNQLVGVDALKADLTKMSWIGKASTDPRAIVISANSPIKSFADLQKAQNVLFSTSGVGSAGYAFARPRTPMFATRNLWPDKTTIDAPLVIGATLFGIGWGLSGLCPGPAIENLATLSPRIVVFVAAMALGMAAHDAWQRRRVATGPSTLAAKADG